MSRHQTTADAAKDVMRIIDEEAEAVGASVELESGAKKKRSNEATVSVKLGSKTFRIWINWIRDGSLTGEAPPLGIGYIETEWNLRLEPEHDSCPVQPPFVWSVLPSGQGNKKPSHRQILDENWLRALIRQKLDLPPQT